MPDTFEYEYYTLVYEFTVIERVIHLRNASNKTVKLNARTQSIIEAYNNIVRLCTPIFHSKDTVRIKNVREKLINIRDRLLVCIGILNKSINAPTDLTKEIDPKTIKDITTNNKMPDENTTGASAMSKIEYYNICARSLTTVFTGDALALQPFQRTIKFLQALDDKKEHEDTLKNFILTKLQGKAADCLSGEPASVEIIVNSLKEKIKPDNSKIIAGRMMAIRADRNNFTDYTKRTEELAEKLKTALVMEGIPNEKANEMTIEKTIELCRANTGSNIVKSVLASTKFDDAKDVVAKFIIESRTETTENNTVLAFNTKYRNNGRNGQFIRNNYNNGNYYRNNSNNFRPNNRGNYRGRGRGYYRGGGQNFSNNNGNRNNNSNYSRGSQNNYNRQNNRGQNNRSNRVVYTENSEAPPSGAAQTSMTEIN